MPAKRNSGKKAGTRQARPSVEGKFMRDLKLGDAGPDVEALTKYLVKFGYFGAIPGSAFAGGFGPLDMPSQANIFDSALHAALLRFQETNALRAEGVLNEDTRSLLNRPRCGLPDIAPDFVWRGSRWPDQTLLYRFFNFTTDVSPQDAKAAVAAAFGEWASKAPLAFAETTGQRNIDIGFYVGDHGDGHPFDGPRTLLAHATYPPPLGPVPAYIHFDDAETWKLGADPVLAAVALHEIGHVLGLDHSSDPNAVMYAYNQNLVRLAADDIAAITSTYGTVDGVRPFFRYWNGNTTDHFYTSSWSELNSGGMGYGFEGVECMLSSQPQGALMPLYRYWNQGVQDHFYTTDWNELQARAGGWGYELIAGYVSRQANGPFTQPLYRYFNAGVVDHFYTTNYGELGTGAGGWALERVECYVMPTNKSERFRSIPTFSFGRRATPN